MKAPQTLPIGIVPSVRLMAIQTLAHLVAMTAILAATLPVEIVAPLLVLVGGSLAYSRKPQVMTRLLLHDDGRLKVMDLAEQPVVVELHRHTTVLSFLVVLLYRQNGRLRSCVVLPDCLATKDFRQLRVWLRWRSMVNDGDGGPG